MFNEKTEYDPSTPSPSTLTPPNSSETYKKFSLMLDKEAALRFLDADCGSKKRKKRKKQRTKKGQTERSSKSCSESSQYLLPYLLGAAHKENELLKTMIKLSLAASKRTLREDVLEVGCEVLDDGKD